MKTLSGHEDGPCSDVLHVSQVECSDVEQNVECLCCCLCEASQCNCLVNMNPFERKKLTTHLQEEINQGVSDLRELLNISKLDLLEVCASADSPLSEAVRAAGGKALVVGLHNGFNLSTRVGYLKVLDMIRRYKPRYVHLSLPYLSWTSLQSCKKIVHHCRKIIEIQLQENFGDGGMTLTEEKRVDGEHPMHAQSWSLGDMKAMQRMCGAKFAVHGCRHGFTCGSTGELLKKPSSWFSTHPGIRRSLNLVCSHGVGTHPHVEKNKPVKTSVYPYLLCRRFAVALSEDNITMASLFAQFEETASVFVEQDAEADAIEIEHEGDAPDDVVREESHETVGDTDDEIKRKLSVVHRNLGHPNQESMYRMLKDSGATPQVLHLAKSFECEHCLQRGRRAPARPAALTKVFRKWECVSIDTFWWHTPKEALKKGCKPIHAIGLSILDEATDYHVAVIVKVSEEGPLRNISAEDFRRAFTKGWLQNFPAPSLFRYDEEGFMRSLDIVQWLEVFGMKLEPIAGKGAWQMGKHSRHLQTLKEQMNLLKLELGDNFSVDELLSLSLGAKNSMHQIRGYTPNQWALGQEHPRISSFLQQAENLPWNSARENPTFEDQLQAEAKAREHFIQIDAKRRISRALHAKCRRIQEFSVGDLVYYFRKGVKQGSRYGGTWHGPARVLVQEKTSPLQDDSLAGSIVWVSHAGRLLRCCPEQIRHVTHDLRHLDREINGPQNYFDLLKNVAGQQKFLDLSQEDYSDLNDKPGPDEVPRFRAHGKQSLADLHYGPRRRPLESNGAQESPPPFDSTEGESREDGPGGQNASGSRDSAFDRIGNQDTGKRRPSSGGQVPGHLSGSGLQQVGSRTLPQQPEDLFRPQSLHDLHETPAGRRSERERSRDYRKRDTSANPDQHTSNEYGLKRQASTGIEQFEYRERRHPDDFRKAPGWHRGRSGGELRLESSGRDAGRTHRSQGTPGQDGGSLDPNLRTLAESKQVEADGRSRSPPRAGEPSATIAGSERLIPSPQDDSANFSGNFSGFVGSLDVVEFELLVAPRDVHMKSRGVWMVNSKVRKATEVCVRKLTQTEQAEFEEAMKKEIDSFLSSEAIQICSSAGIPPERILRMRWIHVWKPVHGENGELTGKKAKARLIIRGYEDPRLTCLPREAPTLSCLGRNWLLAETARLRFRLSTGDIRTAFLQQIKTELNEGVYGMPPDNVRQSLNMAPHEILRIAKAVYGLLNAPKRWYESLSQFLLEDGWLNHSLDKCLFKRVDSQGNICGFLGIHVDDVLCSGAGEEYESSLERLRKRFTFGSWETAWEQTVQYCGCEIKQNSSFGISLKQEKFSLGIEEINISYERKQNLAANLTESEKSQMRQKLGAMNWRATQSAPWLLSTVSHLQGCVEQGTVQDLLSTNRLVRLQIKRFDQGLYFPPLTGECSICTFTDASWATRKDGSSQGGQITLLVQKNMLKGEETPFSVLCWTSRRLKRVARSSTSAEAQMSANALDTHEFAKLGYFDMLTPKVLDLRKSDDYLKTFESCLVGDARNIYDGINKVETSGLHMEERRTAIELLSIKERLRQARVTLKWVDGEQEMADGLTKPWKHEPLIKALSRRTWKLVYDPKFQSARRKRLLQNASDTAWLTSVFHLAGDQIEFWDLCKF